MPGFPPPRSAPPHENLKAFREGLREVGYAVGKNVIIERRYTKDRPERLPKLAEELVRLKVDAIIAASTPSIRSAIRTTDKVPIVILSSAEDPVTEGFVESLARPGGNITGVSGLGFELSGKLLELLTEAVPARTPIGVLSHPVNRAVSLPATKSVADALKTSFKL